MPYWVAWEGVGMQGIRGGMKRRRGFGGNTGGENEEIDVVWMLGLGRLGREDGDSILATKHS